MERRHPGGQGPIQPLDPGDGRAARPTASRFASCARTSSRCSSGFHWPSEPWGDEEIGVGAGASFAAPGGQAGGSLEDAIAHYVELYADRIADTPAARAALTTIFSAAARGTPPGNRLPPDVADAYRTLDRESGMGDGGPGAAPGDDREPFNPGCRVRQLEARSRPGAVVRRRWPLEPALAAAADCRSGR